MALPCGSKECGTNQRPGCGGERLQEKALMPVFLLDTTVIVDTLNGKKAGTSFSMPSWRSVIYWLAAPLT
jgi:hypothetical protein